MTKRFEWDETKRRANIKKHGLDFAELQEMFDGEIATIEDERLEYGETRYITFGMWHGKVVVVAHTESEEVIRIISARKATKYEEKQYLESLGY